jgi:hypothetical protein
VAVTKKRKMNKIKFKMPHLYKRAINDFILVAICTFLPVLIFCQSAGFQPKITKGELISDDSYKSHLKVLCKGADGSISAIKKTFKKENSESPEYFIEKFDSNLKRISSNQIKTPELGGDETTLFRFFTIGDHFCIFWESRVNKTKTNFIYYSVLENDGSLTRVKKVTETKDEKNLEKNLWILQAPNDSAWVIVKNIRHEKTLVTNFIFEYLDATLNLKWTQKYSPYKENQTEVIRAAFGEDGKIVFMVSNWTTKSKLEAVVDQRIWICDEKGISNTIPLNPPTGFAIKSAMIVFKENDIEILGTYTDINQKKKSLNPSDFGAAGTFAISMHKKDFNFAHQEFTPFPKEIFDYYGVKKEDREDGLHGLSVDDLVVNKSQVLYLVLDNTTGGTYLSGNKYHYSITSLSGIVIEYVNGKPKRHVILPKSMHSDDESSGLGLLIQKTDDFIHFLYNDAPKNRFLSLKSDLEDSGESPMSTTNALVKKKADVMSISLPFDSNPKKQFLLGYKEDGVFLNHLVSLPYDKDSFIFITGIYGNYQLNKLTYRN